MSSSPSPTVLQPRLSLLTGLLGVAVLVRLLPYVLSHFGLSIDPETTVYPWNFSPLPAICLFGGAVFAIRRWAFIIPLAAWLAGDLGIWALTGRADWAFYPSQPLVYGCVALTVWMGFFLRSRRSVPAVAGTGLAASIMFFVVTNFGVWALGDGGLYPHTWPGLTACYVAALPFFRNYLISMWLFSAILFSPLAVVERAPSQRQSFPLTAAD